MREADDLTTFVCRMSWISGSLNLLEPSGPHRACNETPLPFYMCAAGCTHLMYVTWSFCISTNYDASCYADFSILLICCQHHILKNVFNYINVLYIFSFSKFIIKTLWLSKNFTLCLGAISGLVWIGLVCLFIRSVTYVTLDTSATDYNLCITAQLIIYGHPHNII